MENFRRQVWSSEAWVLLTDRQTTRMGTKEINVEWGKDPVSDSSPGGLARTGLFRMGNGGRMH